MIRMAINGFGRIGRQAFKIAFERRDVEIVAINDLTDAETLAHLLKYDTNYGIYERPVKVDGKTLVVGTKKIPIVAEPDPVKLPWKKYKVDVVLECTGRFTDPAAASQHLEAGAKKVVLSAPAKGKSVKTVVLGVNEEVVDNDDRIISNASCTTNCIAPVMKNTPSAIIHETATMSVASSNGLKATKTLIPIAMKLIVSRLLCSFRRAKLIIVPISAQTQIKMNSPMPQ